MTGPSKHLVLEARKNGPYRLLVEGLDDQWSIIHLMERHGIDWNSPSLPVPHVQNSEGAPKLLNAIGAAVKTYERLGVVLDADMDQLNRWTQVRNRLQSHGVSAPNSPPPAAP